MTTNQDNQIILKERYATYRIRMKSLSKGEERTLVKKELKAFLRVVAESFGQDVANELTKKDRKHG